MTITKMTIGQTISVVVIVVIAFAAGLVLGNYMPASLFKKPVVETKEKLNITILEKALEPASDLITQKYVYSDAFSDEQSKRLLVDLPFTKKRVVFTYCGTISAGYDLSKVEPEIDDEKKTVTLSLPDLKIVANEVDPDSYKYIIQEDSIFNPYKPKDMTDFQKKLKKKMEVVAKQDRNFTRAAEDNARNILKHFLESSTVTEGYEIIVK